MDPYEQQAYHEMLLWQKKMQRRTGLVGMLSSGAQKRINNMIPEQVHAAFTTAFKGLVQSVLTGAGFISGKPLGIGSLQEREAHVAIAIKRYKNAAAAEGALTGAGGILLGLADLPLWLTIKLKMLFDIAGQYGFDVRHFRERIFILYVLQLAFSSRAHRRHIYSLVANWQTYSQSLPEDARSFDWRTFQQEYRDYLDIAKLLQLVPGIGAVVGFVVNQRLTDKLGNTAMNAFRMRWFTQIQGVVQSAKS
jgi:hypothetical protein